MAACQQGDLGFDLTSDFRDCSGAWFLFESGIQAFGGIALADAGDGRDAALGELSDVFSGAIARRRGSTNVHPPMF